MRRRRLTIPIWLAIAGVALIVAIASGAMVFSGGSQPAADALVTNPNLDPGTPLSGAAPDFTLTDQSNRPVSLDSFRGKVVMLAFNDSQCTTICPLTTTAMLDAKAMLGPPASQVQLLGIDANPAAIAVKDVRAYSEAHGMVHQWSFLTGSLAHLKRVWKAYNIGVQITGGQIDHTPALFVIDPRGRLAKLYETQLSYAAVPQLGQLLAQEAASLLPGHPKLRARLSYAQISGIRPSRSVSVPGAGGGTVRLGASGSSRLYLFFATWDQEVMNLRAQLETLDAYQRSSASAHLPELTAVDETSLEPSPASLTRFLATLPHALSYPVAIDQTGRLADGYEAQDEPWLVLSSGTGRLLWYYDVSAGGALSPGALAAKVRAALAHALKAPATAAAAQQELAGSPPALASLHQQADLVLGSQRALAARIHALHGYPIVVNVWGSWCAPCVAEFRLFGAASAHYGRRVAFLGADIGDSSADARSFLDQHPVSYPSYQTSLPNLVQIVPQGVLATPTTIFINGRGKLVYVHTGQYLSQGSLDGDIGSYARRG
jgi:cytochrome oxidase Cu insertion factor (SCO1/SenC/PrrC family)/thiol-disulfide isomerase/thioredoxin